MGKEIVFRQRYFQQIKPFIKKDLIKFILGQRRVGKSYILLQLIDIIKKEDKKAQIIYVDKEDYAFDAIRNYHDLVSHVKSMIKNGAMNFLFIDEIQEISEFEKALRSLVKLPELDIYCTGSNSSLLSGELATLLAGRYISFQIHSLSYNEFLLFHNLDNTEEALNQYLKFGGMPYLKNLVQDDNVYAEYLSSVYDTIVLRDVVERYKIRNVRFLKDLIRFLADNTGSLVSAKSISDYLKSQQISMAPKTILEYLEALESVYFINKVSRLLIGGKKIFEINDKYYFEDHGIRNSIIPFQIKDIQKVLENAVYHHLCVMNYEVFVGKLGSKEIDFIAMKGDITVYVQVAYLIQNEKTHKREFGNLLMIDDNHRKIVVSMDALAGGNHKGVEHWHLMRFLSEFE